ncbi:Kelch repeat-containing protein [Bacillus halotolerans]|uniref:Kelch repeat-containing protein n=1 Tax=Bacillus halotolerans TaxID=260554 RepID=UPI002DBCB438|nr:kelch repeat-containing protein [Bacillus halotolerans]MEC1544706.1 kelch repeat-containing protein [Bacillus halotolerans]
MKKIILIFALILCSIVSPFYQAHAAEEKKGWVSQADLPEPRSHAATAVVGDKIYVIGGYGKTLATNTTFVYDSKKNEWSKKSDMPLKLAGSAVAVVKDKIYVMGGNTYRTSHTENSSKLLIYDTKADKWEEGADVPKKSFLGTAVAIDNTIYLMTQQETSTPNHFAYNTTTNKWENKANGQPNSKAAASTVVDGKIYYIGGGSASGGANTIYEYDPVKNSWIKKGYIASVWYTSAVAYDGKIYIIGGKLGTNYKPTNLVQVYDPVTNITSNMDERIQFARAGAGNVVINNDLYTVGGATSNPTESNSIKSVEKYTIKSTSSTNPDQGTNDGNGTKPDDETHLDDGDALLVITMINGLQKEYQLSMKEVDSFLKWYEQRDAGEGPGFYEIDEHDNNKGPFESKKDYVVFKNILMYEVNKYK